jgi:hypothetical protein
VDNKWRVLSCWCGGGFIWSYASESAEEHDACGGTGKIYIRPKGHTFQYPGGPASGRMTKEDYEEATPLGTYFKESMRNYHFQAMRQQEIESFGTSDLESSWEEYCKNIDKEMGS